MQIQSKKLPTKQSQIKTNQKSQIPKIYYTLSLSLSRVNPFFALGKKNWIRVRYFSGRFMVCDKLTMDNK